MKRSILLALLLMLGAAAWVLSGVYEEPLRDVEPAPPALARTSPPAAEEARPAVRVQHSQARDYVQHVVVYGRTEAVRTVEIGAETEGRVVELPVPRGARVKAGQVIARLDLGDRAARLRQAEALVSQREIEFKAAATLKERGHLAETAFAAAKAALDAARAETAAIRLDIERTDIEAPFDGRVERQTAELGSYLQVGDPVALLVDDDPLLAVGQISENDVGRLLPDAEGRAVFNGGQSVAGPLRFIASTADPRTRTFRVELELPNPEHRLRDGLTVELRLPLDSARAHLLSAAALTLDDDGRIGVRAVDAAGRVVFHPAHIVGDSGAGVWLAGLPEVLEVIVVGQDFVRAGDLVNAVPAEGPGT